MSDTSAPTVSIVQVLTDIVEKTVATTQPMTTSGTLLYQAGTNLTPISLGQLSY